jgi:hypothetical protein
MSLCFIVDNWKFDKTMLVHKHTHSLSLSLFLSLSLSRGNENEKTFSWGDEIL